MPIAFPFSLKDALNAFCEHSVVRHLGARIREIQHLISRTRIRIRTRTRIWVRLHPARQRPL